MSKITRELFEGKFVFRHLITVIVCVQLTASNYKAVFVRRAEARGTLPWAPCSALAPKPWTDGREERHIYHRVHRGRTAASVPGA